MFLLISIKKKDYILYLAGVNPHKKLKIIINKISKMYFICYKLKRWLIACSAVFSLVSLIFLKKKKHGPFLSLKACIAVMKEVISKMICKHSARHSTFQHHTLNCNADILNRLTVKSWRIQSKRWICKTRGHIPLS